MFYKKLNLNRIVFILFLLSFKMMAQSDIVIKNQTTPENSITIATEKARPAAIVLKSYLDQSFSNSFLIQNENNSIEKNSKIHLSISKLTTDTSFIIKSNATDIFLIAPNEKLLRYAVYTLLERWGFRKFTAKETYIPKLDAVAFPKNREQDYKPSFEYRALLYPDAYDENFRDWHKLDWHLEDFSVWGHSFSKLLPPQEYFKKNPTFFALYDGNRNGESLCMTNDTVVDLVIQKMQKVIAQNSNASFYSVSQNDDVIYCECPECKSVNNKYGGPQGSLYYFLNKIAVHFPKTKIITLAYLHTFKPPKNLKLQPNVYTLFCPIELNRGKSIVTDNYSKSFRNTLQDWNKTTSHLYLWDYTVQFSNYLSPFPNIHTFSENYKFFEKNNVKGLFVQGYADVPGDFTELRQYLLAKLLWNTDIDIEATTDDFLRGFYGEAAPQIRKYLNLLAENQQKSNSYLDIYSGPVQSRNTFLLPEAMDQYDHLINEAIIAVNQDTILESRVKKLRLALEYVFFEQSKFYGKDKHGMFIVNKKGKKEVKKGITERVLNFTKNCSELGIYELSEGGLSPEQYYEEWLEIAKDSTNHLGEKLKVNFLTLPAEEFTGKGSNGLVDGIRGYKDYNINWIGWYGTNPEIELLTNKMDFNQIRINFLDNQRHWIFKPKKISIYGFNNEEWFLITEKFMGDLTESFVIKTEQIEMSSKNFSKFDKIKLLIDNQDDLPIWRKRKQKKPMIMIDEIELYNK
ncbi:DUF4838 domain-containing protein [Flavobacterium sp. LB2P84]|uniref:DUF4838 domain-containing protein n=1 Tax=Flavobacterium yafengii TaxID=3041253 RepID=UPI0024A8A588|nr:DUF4838 domain-containing protein [Flavobacterium yafengii]MDI6031609.1 DUF4838 domain-containing protein [Flavobacterium yafengii]